MSERNVAVSTDDHGLGRARHPTRHVVVHENGRDAGQDGACLDAEVGHHEASRRKPCEFIAHQGGPCRLAAPDDSDVGRPMACPGEGTSEDGACRQAVGIIVAEDRRSVRSGSGDGASKGCSVYGEIGHARSLSHMHGPSPVRRDRRDRHADPRGGAPQRAKAMAVQDPGCLSPRCKPRLGVCERSYLAYWRPRHHAKLSLAAIVTRWSRFERRPSIPQHFGRRCPMERQYRTHVGARTTH